MSDLREDETVEQLVADISDAFWLVPLNPAERQYFVAQFRGQYLVFQSTAQGSRTAPLTFCALMSVAARLIQSVLLRDNLMSRASQDARMQVYMDDPWVLARGTRKQIDRIFALVLLLWSLLGFPVATHKAARGKEIKWIGMHIRLSSDSVSVLIPDDKTKDLEALALNFLRGNVVSRKELRSFIGKAMSIATILLTWKPFITQLNAALHGKLSESNAPEGCVWTKQVSQPLKWILAFIRDLESLHLRTWMVADYSNTGSHVSVTWGASPWGFGAVLVVDGATVEYLADVPHKFETELLGIGLGDCSSQQVLECLAGLVALRVWKRYWLQRRCKLVLRSDNVGALILLSHLHTSSSRNAVVAREFALDLGCAAFQPKVAEHVPGFSNKTCDALSRLSDPSGKYSIPGHLLRVPRVSLPSREPSWWRSLFPPQLSLR